MVVTIEQAQKMLSELIDQLAAGEEVVIVRDEKPVAVLSSPPGPPIVPEFGCCRGMASILDDEDQLVPRVPGLMKGHLIIVAEDDEHL